MTLQNPGTSGDSPRLGAAVLVIGLGNPILGDDGVGWRIAEEVAARLGARVDVEVDCLAVGGLGLMERMLGYDRVILVDAIETGAHTEGAVTSVSLDDLKESELGHTSSAHDASLVTALETARLMGGSTPGRVDIVAVEARPGLDFSDRLSPRIAMAVPVAAEMVMSLLPAA